MKKIFKLLLNRFTIVLIALILQLLLYIFFPLYIGSKFPSIPINLILNILALITVLIIINSDMIIEGQLPLIILCIIAPVIGIAFCTLFLKVRVPRKFKNFARDTYVEINKNMQYSPNDQKSIHKKLGSASGIFDYIYNTTGFRPSENTSTYFFDSGEKFFVDLCENLKNAKKFIFMEYFIIENGKMWSKIHKILKEKVKNGVEVRVMYDDLGTMFKLPNNFAKKLKKEGINCRKFNEYSQLTSSMYNNRDHRKITVIDGNIGYIGGINIADEYINVIHPFGYWKDSAIKMIGKGVDNLTCLFLQLFDIQSQKKEYFGEYLTSEKSDGKGVVCSFGDGPKYVYGEYIAENVIINMLGIAQKSVCITTPYLIIDAKLKNALINASLRNVEVTIITPHIPDKKAIFQITRSHYGELIKNNIKIMEYQKGFVHAKQILVDDSLALIGTINLDYRSFIHHYECGTLMYQTDSVDSIKSDFSNMISESIDMKDYKQNVFTRLFCALIRVFTPLF